MKVVEVAFPEWAVTSVVECTRVPFRYKMLLEVEEHFEELRDLVI